MGIILCLAANSWKRWMALSWGCAISNFRYFERYCIARSAGQPRVMAWRAMMFGRSDRPRILAWFRRSGRFRKSVPARVIQTAKTNGMSVRSFQAAPRSS